MKTLLVLGATSGISQAYINRVAGEFEKIVLVARDADKLGSVAGHVRSIAKVDVTTHTVDLADIQVQQALVNSIWQQTGGIDCVLISYGQLTDQEKCVQDPVYAAKQFDTNATSTMTLCLYLSQLMAEKGSGTLAVIGSVAGDRGRASNYCYGAAKSAVDSFLSGLRSDMHGHNLNVLTIKPGFVDTPMTGSFKKGFLWASPDTVAKDIDKSIKFGRSILYTPWFWRYIMLVIKSIPEILFKRLPL